MYLIHQWFDDRFVLFGAVNTVSVDNTIWGDTTPSMTQLHFIVSGELNNKVYFNDNLLFRLHGGSFMTYLLVIEWLGIPDFCSSGTNIVLYELINVW